MSGYASRHMRHQCESHGCYRLTLPDWSWLIECLPRGIRPTDVDGLVELGGRFLVLEHKQAGASVPTGQGLALRRLARLDGVTVLVMRPAGDGWQTVTYDGSTPTGWQTRSTADMRALVAAWAAHTDRGGTDLWTPPRARQTGVQREATT